MTEIPPGLAGVLNEGRPARPRPSATVLLLRGSRPWQALMMRRPDGADFAPGAHVFPGGSLHPEDRMLGDRHRGGAIRELFEEVGVLLAKRGAAWATGADCEQLRLRLAHGVNFPTALREAGLAADLDGLAYFARWITPEAVRRRFDTRFYLATMPPGQEIVAQPGEVEDWRWIEPRRALAQGGFTLVFATRKILELVAAEEDAERLLARYSGRRRVKKVMPVIRVVEGRVEIELPGRARPAGEPSTAGPPARDR